MWEFERVWMSAPVRICSVLRRGKQEGYFRAKPALLFAQTSKWNFREWNVVSSSGRWLFGEPPAAISELQFCWYTIGLHNLDYTILTTHHTFITTSWPQPNCQGPWSTQSWGLEKMELAHQEGWEASVKLVVLQAARWLWVRLFSEVFSSHDARGKHLRE